MGLGKYKHEELFTELATVLAEKRKEFQSVVNGESETVKIYRCQGALQFIDDLEAMLEDGED